MIPGSTHLRCPGVLRQRNWYAATFTAEEDAEIAAWRLQAAYRLRAGLRSVPFYAKRAADARLRYGSEMPYWLELQGSEFCAERPAPDESSLDGLTPEDIRDTLPVEWLHPVDRILIGNRGSSLAVSDGPAPGCTDAIAT